METLPKVEEGTTQPQPTETVESVEQTLAKIKAELDNERIEKEKISKRMQGLEGSLKEKDRLLQEKGEWRGEIESIKETQKILTALLAEQGRTTGEEDKGQLLQKYDQILKQQEVKQKEAQLKAQREAYNTKADAIYSKAKELVTSRKDLKTIELLLKNGDPDGAEEIVSEFEKEKKVVEPKVEKEESVEDRAKKLADEMVKKVLEERGLLKQDNITQSGNVQSELEEQDAYIKGKKHFEDLSDAVKRKLRGG
jgi:hypothetical protein